MRKTGIDHHRAKHLKESVERARTLRQKHGWTYRRIGGELGVSLWTVRDWCRYGSRWAG